MLLWNHTLLCEKVEGTASYRMILWDQDFDTGAFCVYDIVESSDIKMLSSVFKWIIDDPMRTFVLHENHKNVNLGRAQLMTTKIRKVLESL